MFLNDYSLVARPPCNIRSGMDSFSIVLIYDGISVLFPLIDSIDAAVVINKIVGFVLDLQLERMRTTNLLLHPFMCVMTPRHMNAIIGHAGKPANVAQTASLAGNFPRRIEVNKNAVMLDDIDNRWYAHEDDYNISLKMINNHTAHNYDDVDLDLSSIEKEAQQYNDCNALVVNLDNFFMQCLLQHIIFHLKESWFELTKFQKLTLCYSVKPYINVFDQLVWFGYDCLIRNSNLDLLKTIEHGRGLNHLSDASFKYYSVGSLAVDFGINFSFSEDVIVSCDKHFETCFRSRMAYTDLFQD